MTDRPRITPKKGGRKPGTTNSIPAKDHKANREFIESETPPKPTPDVPEGHVLVFRRPDTGTPIAVPDEVVLAAERPYRAYCDRLTGMSWEEVAVAQQYPSARAAAAEVNRYLEEGKELVATASAGALITLELARLDALQQAVWPMAMSAHLPSVTTAMQLIMARTKLMGLEIMAEQGEGATAPRTVVVPQDSEGYIAALQEA